MSDLKVEDTGRVEVLSVCQFFKDGSYEYVRRYVPIIEAIYAFKHYTTSVAVKMGMVERVIITDSGDCIVAEWIHGQGLVYPVLDDKNKVPSETEFIKKWTDKE